jgi:hypothetical protein
MAKEYEGVNLGKEFIVNDSIVANLVIKAPALQTTDPGAELWFRRLARLLRGVCLPNEGHVKLFEGRAYLPVYANNRDPKYSCSWAEEGEGGSGHVILAWVDQPKMRVRVNLQFGVVLVPDGSRAWLSVEYNPTSLTVGHNVHPAAYVDPQTGELEPWPSSSWPVMTRDFRLGFDFLEAMTEPEPLFDDATKLTIERGDVPLASEQWAATKTVPSVTEFLQVATVTYGQTKARGETSVDNAKDLGLKFAPYDHEDPNEERLTGLTLAKKHGKKVHVLVSYYDKLVRVREMHQESTLSLAEAVTVDHSVRMDVTAHPSFNLTIIKAAREMVAKMDEADRQFFDFLSLDEFMQGKPKSTVWWVQRAMFLLSHRRQRGRWVRYSFATWLVPFVEKHVLHNDVIAGITMSGYHALLALDDPIAAAWRNDPKPGARNWAGRLARIAGCERSTVYNRRDEWWLKYRIDVAYPLQMYSDILYYGSNSVAKPESITAMMVAVKQKRGGKVVQLHAEAIADFERKRVRILNPALVSRPRAMELNLPPIARPQLTPPQITPLQLTPLPMAAPPIASLELIDFEDVDDDLDLVFPTKPVPSQPTIASSVLKTPYVEQELMRTIVLRHPTAMELERRPRSEARLSTRPTVSVPSARSAPPVGRGLTTEPRKTIVLRRPPAVERMRPPVSKTPVVTRTTVTVPSVRSAPQVRQGLVPPRRRDLPDKLSPAPLPTARPRPLSLKTPQASVLHDLEEFYDIDDVTVTVGDGSTTRLQKTVALSAARSHSADEWDDLEDFIDDDDLVSTRSVSANKGRLPGQAQRDVAKPLIRGRGQSRRLREAHQPR